jgi:hypothetical protein
MRIKLFCRHCWKWINPKLKNNNCHIEATCPKCHNWIKYLNKREVRNIIKAKINVKAKSRL